MHIYESGTILHIYSLNTPPYIVHLYLSYILYKQVEPQFNSKIYTNGLKTRLSDQNTHPCK